MLLQNDPKDVSQNWNKDMHAIRTYSQHCADNIHMVAPQDFVKRHENLARTLQNDDDAFAYVMEPSATMLYFANIGWSRTERPFVIIYSLDDTSATGVAMTIVTPMFEATRAQEQLIKAKLPSDVPVEVVTWIEHESPYETILSVLESKQRRAGQSKTKVYVEATTRLFVAKGISDAIPASSSLATAVASQAIQQLRMVKTPVEVDLMRCAARVTHFAVQKVHPYVKPGLKESEVAAMMTEALAHGGLEETWVVALVDENAALPHGNPAHENVVQPGSLILIDTGGSFYGYQSDLTRTFFAAGDADHTIKTNQTLLDAWQSVKNAQQAVIDTMKKGNSCAQVDLTARHII
ncbi:Creatinase/aminopeptidase, partial [Hesseltinella vesiculosa]